MSEYKCPHCGAELILGRVQHLSGCPNGQYMRPPMKSIAIVSLCMLGCSSGIEQFNSNAPITDAGVVDARDATIQPLCCALQTSIVDDPFWTHTVFDCDLDSSAYSSVPWICGNNLTCTDPACTVGSSCRGFNGTGRVEACPMPNACATTCERTKNACITGAASFCTAFCTDADELDLGCAIQCDEAPIQTCQTTKTECLTRCQQPQQASMTP